MKNLITFTGLVYIEITCQYNGIFAAHFLNFANNQFGTFSAGYHSDMIHVQIKEPEFELTGFVFEFSPRADAGISSIPSFIWLCSVFRQPEVAGLE